ncbi:MAG: SulP family inorganic anion transporter [Bacteroidetes bacterium]|nr:MAG: SulP family inorganic anion transporter [Bacteroidota bacterium]
MFKHIKGDFFGGITAGIVALPLALAFGAQTELGAEAGLYGAIALSIFAALLGGTPTQISGPTGPMTVISITVILSAIALVGGKVNGMVPEAALGIIVATFVLAGILEFSFGFMGIGKYIKYIPYPVVSGFMSGIGFIIIFLQVFDFFGYAGDDAPKTIVGIVTGVGLALANTNITAVILALSTIAIIYLFPRITKAVPSTLVALIVVSVVAYVAGLDVPIIGDIPQGIPDIKLGTIGAVDWGNREIVSFVIEFGFVLAALGAIDSLLTSVVADNLTKTKHNSNKELIGQGIGNVISGIFAGLPGAGATMRTVVNIQSGGKTRISGIIAGILLLLILLGLSKFAQFIPMSVLAGILITVGIGIIDYKGLAHLNKVPRADAIVMLVVLVMTVFVDLLWAVGAGLVLACVLFMKRMGDISEEASKIAPLKDAESNELWPDEQGIPASIHEKVYIKHLEGPFFFGFASQFQELTKAVPEVKALIIRMEKVPFIDQSGLYALEDTILDMERKGVQVLLVGPQTQPRDRMERIRIIPDLISEEHIFPDFESCLKYLSENIDRIHEAA